MTTVVLIPTMELAGAQRVMVTLANTMQAMGEATEVVCLSDGGPLEAELHPDLPYHQLNAPTAMASVPALRKLFNRIKPTAVNSVLQGSYVALLASAGLKRRPVLITGHHNRPREILALNPSARLKATLGALAVAYRASDEVVVVCDDSRDQLADLLRMSPERFTVLPNPVDLEVLDAKSKEDPHPDLADGNGLLVIASLTPKKRVPLAVEMMRKLPDHRLVVMGEGPQRERVTNMITTHSLKDRVTLAGLEPNPFPSMVAAAAVVSVSSTEALPLGLIEAVCLGANVVSTDSGSGTRHILNDYDGARVTPGMSAESIAATLVSLGDVQATDAQIAAKRAEFDRYAVAERYRELVARHL